MREPRPRNAQRTKPKHWQNAPRWMRSARPQRAARDKEAAEAANLQAKKTAAEQVGARETGTAQQAGRTAQHDPSNAGQRQGPHRQHVRTFCSTPDSIHSSPARAKSLPRFPASFWPTPALMLEVEGHTDSVGTDELNLRLSENRASSVRDFLVSQGIVRYVHWLPWIRRKPAGSNQRYGSRPAAESPSGAGRFWRSHRNHDYDDR